ncbi:DUF4337 family protein [Phenylobacterium montanum]|uniref:DUF4337 family protein n=1 Tax=Phenylobacterium montanum TaxID=2823693 RepID=A0A975G033_9CAUL|nr:DUF4337 family protein [Caulobacter sp. S6]QUD88087.1 DUF4337 family protein [Caulobacter sp. S6]
MSDVPLDAHEHAEHAEHAAHSGDSFTQRVSITIAVLAVLAAVSGSLEAYESGSAIISANESVLHQDKATDQWNLYEAKSLKKNLYVLAADNGGPKADAYKAKAKDEGKGQDEAQAKAKELEAESDGDRARSGQHEHHHHWLSVAATLLEMGIAISTIAIITKKRWPWMAAVGLGLAGSVVAAAGYLL